MESEMTRTIIGYRIWTEIEVQYEDDGDEEFRNFNEATPLSDWITDVNELVEAWNALPLEAQDRITDGLDFVAMAATG
jgi:hypothetical protein